MDDRDGLEQQYFEARKSTMKNTNSKKTAKSESRIKSKLEFIKKLPHSVLSNSTMEKARAFFRSTELKHNHIINNNEQMLSANQQHNTVNTLSSSSFDSNFINENTKTNNISLKSIMATIHISTPNMIRVDKINNPQVMLGHQSYYNNRNNYQLSSNYFQNKYKQYLKPTLLLPKQYYNDIVHKRNHKHCISTPKQEPSSSSSGSILPIPDLTYATRIYSPFNYTAPKTVTSLNDPMSILLFNNRPNVLCKIKSLSNDDSYESSCSVIRRLPSSSSSMLTWNQCVRRLNAEYKSTIIALQQAKKYLEQIDSNPTKSISKYTNLVARATKTLSNNERKKTANVTFCLPALSALSMTEQFSFHSTSTKKIKPNKILPSIIFSKPKLIKPVQLDSFSPSLQFESMSSTDENHEKLDSIEKIIRKLNDLNNSLESIKMESSTLIDRDLKETSVQSIITSSPELVLINKKHPSENSLYEEEITYTIETFYKSTDNSENGSSSDCQQVVIIQEKTSEEQFNLAQEKQHQQMQTNDNFSERELKSHESKSKLISDYDSLTNSERTDNLRANEKLPENLIESATTLINSSSSSTTTSLKNKNKSISQISKRSLATKTNDAHLLQTPKTVSSNKLNLSSGTITNNAIIPIRNTIKMTNSKAQSQSSSNTKKQPLNKSSYLNEFQHQTNPSTLSTRKNHVKSIVHQLNANASSHIIVSSLKTNKRTYPSVSIHPTISTVKTTIQRK
ncbi:unnamed protein product [Rotaria socialis]|uniref:Uncharacterized protein n=1 Tax=Rotaria socialis TaxID=392032 RepID=A0A817W973_9BILA|nr:unnamed protein product [Rotaria socialis]CAF4135686.1 unnamed protein product [Rotaria socialis]